MITFARFNYINLDYSKSHISDDDDDGSGDGKDEDLYFVDTHPAINTLFRSANFQNMAHDVCPDDKQTIDPFQYNIIINIPGKFI